MRHDVIVLRAPTYPTRLFLSRSTPQAKQDLLLTTLPETLQPYLHDSVQTVSQTMSRRN